MHGLVARARVFSANQDPSRFTKYHHVVPDDLVQENGGLLEYSVVYTDRALNHMSTPFQEVMRGLHSSLCVPYKADSCVLVPGSGTFGMEAVAHAFAGGPNDAVVVVRNGFFSYRWSEIFSALQNKNVSVCKARPVDGLAWSTTGSPLAPPPIAEVIKMIRSVKPKLVCAPHVETSTGIILPNDYIHALAEAAHEVGAVFVLDGIAAGTEWIDMRALGVDCYLTAPQKGWSGPASTGVVMLNYRAVDIMKSPERDAHIGSYAINLNKWHTVMGAYLSGGHAYHATMPTDALRGFHRSVVATENARLETVRKASWLLGNDVRAALKEHGFSSVAADGYQAPGVVVMYAKNTENIPGKFASAGLQISGGVPFKLNEPEGTGSFRIGLFGLDKLLHVDQTLSRFKAALRVVSPVK